MAPDGDTAPRRKAVNLTVDEALLREAKALDINLSRSFERFLGTLVAEEKARRWRDENREAIRAYNERVDKHGVFSDGLRRF